MVGDIRHGLWKLIGNYNLNDIFTIFDVKPPWSNGSVLSFKAKGHEFEPPADTFFPSQIAVFMQNLGLIKFKES